MRLTIHFETLFRATTLFFAFLLLGIYLWQPDHPYIDGLSIFLAEVLFSVLYIVNGTFTRRYPSARMISIVVLVFIELRLIAVFLHPNWLFLSSRTTYNTINDTLTYVILGTVCCFVGLASGSILAGRRKIKEVFYSDTRFFSIAGFGCIAASLIALAHHYLVGFAGSTMTGDHLNFFTRYVSRFIEPLVLMTISLVAYNRLERKTIAERSLLILTVFVFLAFLALTGSRAAVYEVFIMVIAAFPTHSGEFKVKVSVERIAIVAVLMLLVPKTFNYSTNLRVDRYESGMSYEMGASPVFEQISRRLSILENTMFPLCVKEMGLFDVSDVVNGESTLLASINRIIPGKILGTTLFSEFAYCRFWRQGGCIAYDVLGRTDYVAYEWGMWGIGYQLFGYLGGLGFIFLFTLLLSYVSQKFRNMGTVSSLCLVALGDYAMQFWVKNLGMDSFAQRFFTFYFLMMVYLFFLRRVVKKKPHRRVRNSLVLQPI